MGFSERWCQCGLRSAHRSSLSSPLRTADALPLPLSCTETRHQRRFISCSECGVAVPASTFPSYLAPAGLASHHARYHLFAEGEYVQPGMLSGEEGAHTSARPFWYLLEEEEPVNLLPVVRHTLDPCAHLDGDVSSTYSTAVDGCAGMIASWRDRGRKALPESLISLSLFHHLPGRCCAQNSRCSKYCWQLARANGNRKARTTFRLVTDRCRAKLECGNYC